MKKQIPIYFVTNWDMAAYTTTTMVSLLSNTKCNCDFYIMDCGLSISDRKRLLTLKEQFQNLKSLSFSTVDIARFKGMNSWYYGTLDAWAMLLFPESFPEVHGKAIHIESDTLVVDDIEKLYNEDLNGYTIGAAPDIAFIKTSELFPSKEHYYFNLGMIMIDCDKWRENNTTKMCLDLGIKYEKKFFCLHQDALNMLYYNNNYKKLPNRYNLGERQNYVQNIHPDLSDEYFNEEWKHPVIIHFSPNKPWRTQNNTYSRRIAKYFNDWWFYAAKTPYIEGLRNSFIASKIRDGFKGLQNGDMEYGNNMLDTLTPKKLPEFVIDTSKPIILPCTDRYRLLGLPFMKVKTDQCGSRHYKLFWFLPVFKIKTDSKGGKTYKLFSFLPLWNVKAK